MGLGSRLKLTMTDLEKYVIAWASLRSDMVETAQWAMEPETRRTAAAFVRRMDELITLEKGEAQ